MTLLSKHRALPLALIASAPFFFSTNVQAKAEDQNAKLSASPTSVDTSTTTKIQKESYSYQSHTETNASIDRVELKQALLRKSSTDLLEGSFILKNTANKDFLLKSITSDQCATVGQFQDTQAFTEETEDASGNIFKNLPIPRLNTIAFPFSSFHLSCLPKEKASFVNGQEVPFIFHFKEGDKTYNFTFQTNDETNNAQDKQ
ncbi:hypothetical protein FAI40_01085 [Acetobacteraceae bacterium]|nr:hypothetical protein FAI40_01085 [Acetobacteraceae bacterium]